MLFRRFIATLGATSLLSSTVWSRPALRPRELSNGVDDSCGALFDFVNQGYSVFFASDAYNCLVSVPFNDAVALRFINYLNETYQYQSTTAYLKKPPQGYQQPAVDFLGGLADIKRNVTSKAYKNEYAFEVDVQRLIYSVHDAHVDLVAGVMFPFVFASPVDVVSVSVDGKSPPAIYLRDDVVESKQEGWNPSSIATINGEDPVSFLTKVALVESVGNLEPNADWNQLMGSPAIDIQGNSAIFSGGLTFYPGGDNLNFTFANGSRFDTIWIAYYVNTDPTGPLTTGGDFYNYFVLNFLPAACDDSDTEPASCKYSDSDIGTNATTSATTKSTTTSSASQTSPTSGMGAAIMAGLTPSDPANATSAVISPNATSTLPTGELSWYDDSAGAYPNTTFVRQADLGITGLGVITGYVLDDISTAVLSIPTFLQYGRGIETFSETVADFIDNITSTDNIKHIVIDLQQNRGGAVVLAFSTFKQFFPAIEPFAASRRRSHPQGDILGEVLTGWWDTLTEEEKLSLYPQYAANEWIITDRLNAETGKNFTSWKEYYGPRRYYDDNFSLLERYNLSNPTFDAAAFSAIPAGYVAGQDGRSTNPFDAKDIVILTDGLCSSACSLFVEMMTRQAGVRTIVFGGRPVTGPMQAVSGSRGALLYSGDDVDNDIYLAQSSLIGNPKANATLPQLQDGYRDSGVFQIYTGLNLRDQIRANDTVPLQFKYLAADCRMYYTLNNVYNFTQLWRDAAEATWNDTSLCVPGSLGFVGSANTTTPKAPPAAPNLQANFSTAFNLPASAANLTVSGDGSGLQDAVRRVVRQSESGIVPCSNNACNFGGTCQPTSVTCPNLNIVTISACLQRCRGPNPKCPGANFYCQPDGKADSRAHDNLNSKVQYEGWCRPIEGTELTPGCS